MTQKFTPEELLELADAISNALKKLLEGIDPNAKFFVSFSTIRGSAMGSNLSSIEESLNYISDCKEIIENMMERGPVKVDKLDHIFNTIGKPDTWN